MWWLRGGLIAAGILAIMAAGNAYGPNARRYADCKSETARRNAAIGRVNASENAARERELVERAEADRVFRETAKNLPQCILTKEQADALNRHH